MRNAKAADLHVRWMIRRDMPSVLEIECRSFSTPWNEEDFIRCLRQRNCIGMVAEVDEDVAGFMVYELHKNRIQLLNFAVSPSYRRRGVGRSMLKKIIHKLSHDRRNRIFAEVRETNLDAQKFFRAMTMRAISVLRGQYDDPVEDAYLFQYRLTDERMDI